MRLVNAVLLLCISVEIPCYQALDAADFVDIRHKYIPANYPHLGRRFVLQYPYSQKDNSQVDDEADEHLNNAVKAAIKKVSDEDRLRPVKAAPEVVLAVAKQSALLENSKPLKKLDENVKKDILRNGEYWNTFWKEDVPDPTKSSLRTKNKHIESVKVKIMPGSKLHKLVSMTKDLSPRYIYIINNKEYS